MDALLFVYGIVGTVLFFGFWIGFITIIQNTAATNKTLKAISMGQDQEIFALQSILEQLGGEWIWEEEAKEPI
ncbi:MAG: hypothetical protein U9R51_02270 [Actinomycetota bacterium]|nr:hypothetical protein [Actinomycetota bacterium]